MVHFAKKEASRELFLQSSSETAHPIATMQRELAEEKKQVSTQLYTQTHKKIWNPSFSS